MYLPKHFEETRPELLYSLVHEHPFATLVVMTDAGLSVDHLPFLLDPPGVLKGHVARANPLVRATLQDTDAVAVFEGPDHYVTPSWYPAKHETAKVVPTWNYVVVHAYGRLKLIDDVEWLRRLVSDLTDRMEASRESAWKVSDAPDDFIRKQLGGIVGVELLITRFVGKWKLGQTRPEADRLGMIEGLRGENDRAADALAGLMEQSLTRDT